MRCADLAGQQTQIAQLEACAAGWHHQDAPLSAAGFGYIQRRLLLVGQVRSPTDTAAL